MNPNPPKKQPATVISDYKTSNSNTRSAYVRYELYEERGREDGHDEENWGQD